MRIIQRVLGGQHSLRNGALFTLVRWWIGADEAVSHATVNSDNVFVWISLSVIASRCNNGPWKASWYLLESEVSLFKRYVSFFYHLEHCIFYKETNFISKWHTWTTKLGFTGLMEPCLKNGAVAGFDRGLHIFDCHSNCQLEKRLYILSRLRRYLHELADFLGKLQPFLVRNL